MQEWGDGNRRYARVAEWPATHIIHTYNLHHGPNRPPFPPRLPYHHHPSTATTHTLPSLPPPHTHTALPHPPTQHTAFPPPPNTPATHPSQVRAQELRSCYREAAKDIRSASSSYASDMERLRSIFPEQALADDGHSVDLPFTADGLKMAILNAET